MEEIVHLLKFGKKEYLEKFVDGKLYFGNAKLYRGIEEDLKIKGQGDKLEASTKVFSDNMRLFDYETNELAAELKGINIQTVFRFPDADPMPIFCLFAVYAKDCIIDDNGDYRIHLSEKTKEMIKQHFPKADSVAIIKNPQLFITDVKNTIGCKVEQDIVHYFNIDQGYTVNLTGKTANDQDYHMYLTQDTSPVMVKEGKQYSFEAKYLFRILFCKDVFFKDEQEYRIVLPNERIDTGKEYDVQLTEKINILPIDAFFEGC